MKPMKVFFGYLILWAICAVLALLSFIGENINVVMLSIAMGVMVVGNIAYYFLYKCPHCDRHLFNRVAPWHYCPYCGNHLNADPVEYSSESEDEDDKRDDGLKIQ